LYTSTHLAYYAIFLVGGWWHGVVYIRM